MSPNTDSIDDLVATWTVPPGARLGSSVRSRGIYLEVRARLPVAARKSLTVQAGELTLRMAQGEDAAFARASAVVAKVLAGIESLPVIPREIEDILGITTTERHRWLKDGRLPSAGTRTVKLRGRARQITFHVFDPHVVEDIQNRDVVDAWREEDAERAAENRRRAAWNRKLARSRQTTDEAVADAPAEPGDNDRFKLRGWAEFERESLLR